MSQKRSFLFLQGPCSPLFLRLADHLTAHGHTVHKIHFNSGDAAYWASRKALWFREQLNELPEFLENVWKKYGITDQILFGDCRPVHRSAAMRAEQFNIRTHVFDGGYFRPLWITLELGGVNGHSLLPRDPDWFWDVGGKLPEPAKPVIFHPSFFTQAMHDVLYHLAGVANPVLFPHYRNHIPIIAPLEYACYIRRFSYLALIKKQEVNTFASVLADKSPFYLLPLQLNTDAQILNHSPFDGMVQVIEYVMRSFAKHAPSQAKLVIKNHPLDIGLVDYRKIIQQYEWEFDLQGRTVYLESGVIGQLLTKATGTVTVNSTSGGFALELACPTITLADPIYNLPGLTFQGELDEFWTALPKPDAELFRRFRNIVIHTTQINGSLYCQYGTKLAAYNAARVLEAEQSPLEALL